MMRKKYDSVTMLFVFSLFVIGGFASCGTTSKVKPTAAVETSVKEQKLSMDLSRYERVLVQDFMDRTSEKMKPAKRVKYLRAILLATADFPEMIAAELRTKGSFTEVTRNGVADEKTLLITGTITQYKEGDSLARLMIGFGAGSAKFDALIELKDGANQTLLGKIEVDKNSWALGGAIAATQTVQNFMESAAKKIATQVAELRPQIPQALASQGQIPFASEPAKAAAASSEAPVH